MYHKLFDSSFKMTVCIIRRTELSAGVSGTCLPKEGKNMFCFFLIFYCERQPQSCRPQGRNLFHMMKQRQRADIVNDIITVLTPVFHRKQFSIPVFQMRNGFFFAASGSIFMYALTAHHQRLTSIENHLTPAAVILL